MEGVFLVSDSDRYINAFDPQSRRLVMNLIAEKDVSSLSLYSGAAKPVSANVLPLEKQVLAVVTDDGTVELFTKPFSYSKEPQASKGSTASLKARGKQMTRRADAFVKIVRSEESASLVPVISASFQGPELVIAWADGGIVPVFERVRWLDDKLDELSFTGVKTVVKSKSGSALGTVTVNGKKSADESHVDESKAVVEQGNLAEDDVDMQDAGKDAASESESDNGSDVSDDERGERKGPDSKEVAESGTKHGDGDSDVEMENAPPESGAVETQEDGEELGEPSFGDLLHARRTDEIDVEAELDNQVVPGRFAKPTTNNAIQQIPSGVSLSTVLAQSLKTNDSGMLESCFHTGDLSIIRSTIQRLDSMLAATLLQRLAERLSSRPGRYGHLLVWVQWTCVVHGGALAGKPDLLKRMSTLFKVMDQRSSSLPSLLLLKGKLDMLDAQLGLRQSLLRSDNEIGIDNDDEENVIYVEGEEEEDADADDNNSEANKNKPTPITPRTKTIRDQTFDEQDDRALINGVAESDDGEEEDDDEDEEEEEGEEEGENDDNNLLDTEAEESAGSSDAEESVEENEDEDDDEDEEDSAASVQDFIADSDEEESDPDQLESVPQHPPPKKTRKVQKQ